MTLSTLDSKTALLVIDLQNAVVRALGDTIAPVVANAARLADAFRAKGLPVVLVTAAGMAPGRTERPLRGLGARTADAMELTPELDGSGIRLVKRTWGAFHGTELHERLQDDAVTQVVVVGIATSMAVESTARAAYEHGYNVALAVDAIADMDPVAHANSVERIFPALGETGTTDDVISLLGARSDAPLGTSAD